MLCRHLHRWPGSQPGSPCGREMDCIAPAHTRLPAQGPSGYPTTGRWEPGPHGHTATFSGAQQGGPIHDHSDQLDFLPVSSSIASSYPAPLRPKRLMRPKRPKGPDERFNQFLIRNGIASKLRLRIVVCTLVHKSCFPKKKEKRCDHTVQTSIKPLRGASRWTNGDNPTPEASAALPVREPRTRR
jgi:hypothetical protein